MDYRAGRWKGSRQPNSEQKTGNKSGKTLINNVKYHFQPIFSKEVSDSGRGMCCAIPQGAVMLPPAPAPANGLQGVFAWTLTPVRQQKSFLTHG